MLGAKRLKYDGRTGIGVLLWRKYMANLHYIRVVGSNWKDNDGGDKVLGNITQGTRR